MTVFLEHNNYAQETVIRIVIRTALQLLQCSELNTLKFQETFLLPMNYQVRCQHDL